jgi:hypothetical protein
MIISKELKPVILTPTRTFRARILSVTTAIESPTERTSLSSRLICRKKTSVQAKPGRKNISTMPRIALTPGRDSSSGKNGDSQSKALRLLSPNM